MTYNSNDVKSKQLGMPFGTAMGRLRPKILFNLLKKYGDNICYRCNKKINKSEDLSIDHKQPWLYYPENDNRRFWHMSNIAFSHRRCNILSKRSSIKLRKIGPTGTIWCSICKEFMPKNKFYKDKFRWHGYRNKCKECCEKERRKWRQRKKQEGR